MKRVLYCAGLFGVAWGSFCGVRSASSGEVVAGSASTNGLVVVPFAVPVAVPVAVVQQPTLFYGVSSYGPPAAVSASSPVAVSPTSPNANSAAEDPLRAQVAAVFARRCAECHRGSQAQGDLMLFDVDGRLLDKLPRQWIVEQATSAEPAAGVVAKAPAMPPGDRSPLTSDEQALVRKWAVLPKRLSY